MRQLLVAVFLTLPLVVEAALPEPGEPGAPADLRYCGEPRRNKDGSIYRDRQMPSRFAKTWPCPSTGKNEASCPGWAIDHIIPLACGGCDLSYNAAWMPLAIKSAPGNLPKDRWERKVYCPRPDLQPGQPLVELEAR